MEGRRGGDVEVEFAVELPVIFVFDQVVEADVLELAERAGLRTRDHVTGRVDDGVRIGDAAVRARQIEAGVAERGPAALRVLLVGTDGEVALHRRQLRAVAVAGRQQHAGPVRGLAEGEAGVVVAVRAVDERVAGLQLQPVEVATGDEVDDAADGVGAVGGGRAVLQHFDPADGRGRDQVGVHIDGAGRGGHPAAVEQHQGAFGAEAAQVGAAGARGLAGPELVRFTDRALHGRDRLDQVDRRRRPLLLQFVVADDVDRQGGVFGRAGDERAGDHDLFDHRGVGGLGRRLAGAERRGDGECRSCQQIMRASHAFPHL